MEKLHKRLYEKRINSLGSDVEGKETEKAVTSDSVSVIKNNDDDDDDDDGNCMNNEDTNDDNDIVTERQTTYDQTRVNSDDEISKIVGTFIASLKITSNKAEQDGGDVYIAMLARLYEGFQLELRENRQLSKYVQEEVTSSPSGEYEVELVRAVKILEKWRLNLQKDDLCDVLVKPPILR